MAPPDPVRRGAARVATLVALPVALAVAALSLWVLRDRTTEPPAPVAPPPSGAARNAGPVTVDARDLDRADAAVCRAVVDALPDRLPAGPRRPVSDGPDQNAAFGDPPVVLACGVPAVTPPSDATIIGLDGVCWYGRADGAGTVWTTLDRRVPLAVTVPGASAGSGQVVIPFAAAVVAADPAIPDPPRGCP